jgi:hypothetical protein
MQEDSKCTETVEQQKLLPCTVCVACPLGAVQPLLKLLQSLSARAEVKFARQITGLRSCMRSAFLALPVLSSLCCAAAFVSNVSQSKLLQRTARSSPLQHVSVDNMKPKTM